MKHTEFLLHLINEIAHYILDANPMRMVISLHQEEDGLHLAILDDKRRNRSELDKIRNALQPHDRPELAGYYGSMAGYTICSALPGSILSAGRSRRQR